MMDAKQLADLERSMREEHRKDLEALARLKRFLPTDGVVLKPNGSAQGRMDTVEDAPDTDESAPTTIIATVASIMQADSNHRWTIPAMLAQLKAQGFPLAAQKPEATLGLVFSKLRRRGVIRIVRRGSGSTPHVYRANLLQEGDSEMEAKNERPANGQAVGLQ